uniref:Uncharacterized protein n=1 Tax=Glossina pallidipes TaxID=7398 RepID=A0A1B0AGB5_GLOPL
VGLVKPVEFYNTIAKSIFNVEHKICFVTDSRVSNPYGPACIVNCLGNVIGGHPVLYSNQPVELLLKMGAASLKPGEVVWVGCEISKRFAFSQGVEDFKMVHSNRALLCLIYGEYSLTHALLFTAVSLDENTFPNKLQVENAWNEYLVRRLTCAKISNFK